jgi:hypothetical protein
MHGELIVYERTPLGISELTAPRSNLGHEINGLLVLVTGGTTHHELMAVAERLGAPPDSLQVLENGRYIRADGSSGSFIKPDLPATHDDAVAPTYSGRQALLYQHLINATRPHLGLREFSFTCV